MRRRNDIDDIEDLDIDMKKAKKRKKDDDDGNNAKITIMTLKMQDRH